MTTTERRRGSGRRISISASYIEKAACHSEQDADGCWRWVGTIHNGVPHVRPHPDSGLRGIVNLRAAVLVESGVDRPPRAGVARPICGSADCVRPDHLDWTPAEERAEVARAKARPRVSLDQLREAQRRREAGEPVGRIAADLGISRQGLYRQWARWLGGGNPRQ